MAGQPPTSIQDLLECLKDDNKVKVAGKPVLNPVKLSKAPRAQVSTVRTFVDISRVPPSTDRYTPVDGVLRGKYMVIISHSLAVVAVTLSA
jgi:hypothetical protein